MLKLKTRGDDEKAREKRKKKHRKKKGKIRRQMKGNERGKGKKIMIILAIFTDPEAQIHICLHEYGTIDQHTTNFNITYEQQ